MSIIDKFLDVMRLNDDDYEFDNEDYDYDEEEDYEVKEKKPSRRERKKEDQYRILLEFAGELEGAGCGENLKERTRQLLETDMEKSTNPEIFKRFLRKGWALAR